MRDDLELYRYRAWDERLPIRWPGGARLAFWVAPNIEFYELDPPANPSRRAWPRPVPDVQGYATRDYGNRVGMARMMAVLDKHGVRGSVSLSAAVCDHHPEIIELGVARGWEFFSHGIYNTRYAYGMDEAQERAMIEDSMAAILRHTGQPCAGYLAPALTHTEQTLDLFAEAGGIYTCDLFHDDQPTPRSGAFGQAVRVRALLAGTQRHHRLRRQPGGAEALRRDDQAGLRPAPSRRRGGRHGDVRAAASLSGRPPPSAARL